MLDFQQKKQLSILVKIAMVDEDFADEEKAVIEKIIYSILCFSEFFQMFVFGIWKFTFTLHR